MWAYALKRIVSAVPTLILASVMVFGLMRLIPGDPAMLFVGEIDDPAMLEAKRRELGLDQPLVMQYLNWAGGMLRGDMGLSIQTGRPVAGEIAQAFPVTAIVVLAATTLAALLAIPAGIIAGWKQNSRTDAAIVSFVTLCLSIPGFWTALLLLTFLGAKWKLLPTVGYVSVFEDFRAGAVYLIMPVIALATSYMGSIARITRSSMLEVLNSNFIRTARAKGLPTRTVIWRHALKPTLLPVVSYLGPVFVYVLTGSVFVDIYFSTGGLGQAYVGSALSRDYAVLLGVTILYGVLTVLVNLLTDLAYAWFDPKIRY